MFAWICLNPECGTLSGLNETTPPRECSSCGCPFLQKQPVAQWVCRSKSCGASIIVLPEFVPRACGICTCPFLQRVSSLTSQVVVRRRVEFPISALPVIVSFLEPVDAWRLRAVSKQWRAVVDLKHWPVVPSKIDARSPAQAPLAQIAYRAMEHVRRQLRSAQPVCLTNTATVVQRALARRYSELSSGKDISMNCVAVYDNGMAKHFVLNFFPWPHSIQRMFEQVTIPSSQSVSGALAVMRRLSHMHAEIRILHEGHDPESIDKPMCVFCAATFCTVKGQVYESHGGTLQWYTFSTRIFSTRERVRAFFGDEFASEWFSSDNTQRTSLLGYCVAFTNTSAASNLGGRSLPGPPCRRCGTLLTKKTGRFGEFWGCPRWPQCQG